MSCRRVGMLAAAAALASVGATSERLYEPPVPGSYELPAIAQVSEWLLRDVDDTSARLPDLAPGGVAVVAFGYRTCRDATGCPAMFAAMQRLDREIAKRADLVPKTQLVTVSFDPGRDSPERMAELRALLAPRSDWRFLTARSEGEIAGVLSDYGQDAVWLVDPNGERTGEVRHVLKVFLLDAERRVRNVYSSEFLSWRLMLADVETILGEH